MEVGNHLVNVHVIIDLDQDTRKWLEPPLTQTPPHGHNVLRGN